MSEKQLENQALSLEKREDLQKLVQEGIEAEQKVIAYTNTLLTANNTRIQPNQTTGVPDPHPCSIDPRTVTDKEKDYEDIINCCQRHVCRLNGYCK